MAAPGTCDDRDAAHVRAFRLVHDIQAGEATAAGELELLTSEATERGWSDVVRAGLFGRAVADWIARSDDLRESVELLLDHSQQDGDMAMAAVALAMRSMFRTSPSTREPSVGSDADLVRAVVLIEQSDSGPLERISAHTACGIAFGDRWLWELGDEQYAQALAVGETEPAGSVDFLLLPVLYNRAEVQVSWAAMLRQVGDEDGVRERLRAWTALRPGSAHAAGSPMPTSWQVELVALGHLLATIAGEDRSREVTTMLAVLEDEEPPPARSLAHLRLALAVHAAAAHDDQAAVRAEEAVAAIDPIAHPHEYDLALYLAAEVEAASGHAAGLRVARRQLDVHWASRSEELGAMRARIHTERVSHEHDVLARQARLDALTGVGNRRAFELRLDELQHAVPGREIALVMVDVDRLKELNDRFGHAAGDAGLVAVAQALTRHIRSADLAVRLGGDEFALVLADADIEVALRRADAIVSDLAAQAWERTAGMQVTVSAGVAVGDPANLADLEGRADAALYEAKAGGGNRVARAAR